MFDPKTLSVLYHDHRSTLDALVALETTLNRRFYGMARAVECMLLAALTGEAMVMIGPPGTAKSRLVRSFCNIVGVLDDDALTDGLLIIRYLFGLTGTSLTSGAIGPSPLRSTPADVALYLDGIRFSLDVDGNAQADALTDGLMLIRYLFRLRGPTLISGAIGAGATRAVSQDIENYLQSLMP